MQIRFLTKFLQNEGFLCFFKCKAKVVNEGLMIAFRKDRFKLIDKDSFGIRVSDLLDVDKYPENEDINKYLSENTILLEKFMTRPTVLQV